ncbi:hypothetical protein ACSBPQ_14615 [Stenotrophomonas sp. JC08]|uniref:hypothetical protein n=1 Tax=Stenotrophomonas sp. JC08 TaxID=3445779 RepID=UPI003FA23861
MTLNTIQRIVVGLGAFALALSLVWVPFSAHLVRSGDNYDREVGYGLVFQPPQETGCEFAFGKEVSRRRLEVACAVKVETSRVVMTASAIAVATIALFILAGIFGNHRSASGAQLRERIEPDSLAAKLKKANAKFPVSGGNCTNDDPLIITEKKDYASIEYAVAEMIMKSQGLEFKFTLQGLENRGKRYIDVLTYNVKEGGDTEWTSKRSFYFDITAGYERLIRRLR